MATIEMPISDAKLLELLKEKYGLEPGKGRLEGVQIVTRPPTSNSIVSHRVTVTFEFGLELGEAESLIGF